MKKHWLQILSTGVLTLLLAFAFGACGSTSTSNNSSSVTVHLGYFPNITHAVALVGVERGTFKNALGSKCQFANNDV